MSKHRNAIEIRNGKPQISIGGRTYGPMAFATLGPTTYLEDGYLRRLGKAGIELFFIHCNLPWLDDPRLDTASLAHNLSRLRREVPGAKALLRLNLHPPRDWLEENPAELFHLESGELYRTDYTSCFYSWKDMPVYSLVSSKWRADAGEQLRTLLDTIDAFPDGEAVVGHFLAAGATSEWIQRGGVGDYGDAFRRHFSQWLRSKYGNVGSLREAWRQPTIDFDRIPLPASSRLAGVRGLDLETLARTGAAPSNEQSLGSFANPKANRDVLDFYEAARNGVVESIEHFARLVKDHSRGRLLTGAFHGTLYNTGLRRVLLESKHIDFLANPGIYVNRRPGEITDTHCISDSFLLHDKIYMVEDDVRTHRSPPVVREHYFIQSADDAFTQMKRDFGRDLCRNLYGWWFDMYDPDALSKVATVDAARTILSPPHERGTWWYDAPELLALIKQMQKIAQESLTADCRRCSDIAVIVDERSAGLSLAAHSRMLNWRMSILSRIGAPVDFFYSEDLTHPRMPDYKFYIFPNAYTMDDAQRRAVDSKVRRNGAVALWIYAAGVHSPENDSFSAANAADLTGFELTYAPDVVETAFTLIDDPHPAIAGCSSGRVHGRFNYEIYRNGVRRSVPAGCRNYQAPNLYVSDPEAEVLGSFSANGFPALALRDFGSWRSVYCAAQFMEPELLRALARYAGCHIACDSDDFIFMNTSYLNVHAASGGRKTLSLPRPCSPVELYTGVSFGEEVREIVATMEKGETLTFGLS
ncbi:MAG: hypothetical protein HN742_14405 [Lentisphaerae bacterium]|jgi:hypothetical protein|nr:hypothetical protein [Lentisphaerota bacterium]MBT4816619.1 hypothetical protein [Lentisphaerota bacterium]MBT5604658.1 hypothetical protein [Lentisphaerota bacterium]MBT7057758.1 hypothetical protein [Lentisphaerota bacterium]MBT7843067.1 hypothetical protein [Lentisphaerota bacterium]